MKSKCGNQCCDCGGRDDVGGGVSSETNIDTTCRSAHDMALVNPYEEGSRANTLFKALVEMRESKG